MKAPKTERSEIQDMIDQFVVAYALRVTDFGGPEERATRQREVEITRRVLDDKIDDLLERAEAGMFLERVLRGDADVAD